MRFSPQILPIMSINTVFLVMVMAPRAPLGFKVEHVKVLILGLHLVQQVNSDFIFRVSKCAHLSILTILHVIWISLTKLGLILLRMVKLFNSVMRFGTLLPVAHALVVSVRARNLLAHLTGVGGRNSSPILLVVMVVKAPLWVMQTLRILILVLRNKRTWLRLEFCQI